MIRSVFVLALLLFPAVVGRADEAEDKSTAFVEKLCRGALHLGREKVMPVHDWTRVVEPTAVGAALLQMPLFLTPDVYILVPLEATYQSAWDAVPSYWRDVLSGARAT